MQKSSLHIKKLLLGIGVLAVFIVYSFAARHDDSNKVVAPASAKSGTSNTGAAATNSTPSSSSSGSTSIASSLKDGTYTGSSEDAFYGNIQVQAVISDGKLTDVVFLDYPNDNPNSTNINQQAMPYLKKEAIQAQSASVDVVSGATDTSQAFVRSLDTALKQAQNS